MRIVMATVLMLVAAGYVGSHAGSPPTEGGGTSASPTSQTAADDGWRRTSQGWERCEHWQQTVPVAVDRPAVDQPVKKTVHPLALAGVQVLAVTGLWLLTRAARTRRDEITRRTGGEHAGSQSTRPAGA